MKFSELPLGAKFKLYARGAIRVKTSPTGIEINGAEVPGSLEALVIPVDLDAGLPPAEAAKKKTSVDLAREMLERIGVPNVRTYNREALAELTALIERASKT